MLHAYLAIQPITFLFARFSLLLRAHRPRAWFPLLPLWWRTFRSALLRGSWCSRNALFTLSHKKPKTKSPAFKPLRTLQKSVFQQLFPHQWLPHSFAKHRGVHPSRQVNFCLVLLLDGYPL
jgi:hypothetical protein